MKKIYLFILFFASLIVISNNNNFQQTKDGEELSSNIVVEQSVDSMAETPAIVNLSDELNVETAAFLSQVKNEPLDPVVIKEEIPVNEESPVTKSVPLSNDDYYTNVDGEEVRLTGHGGVAEWL